MLKSLPINTASFRKIIQDDFLYIDKTEYVHYIARQTSGAYFLSRPRRFGKSLLVSTLAELFQGHRELFKGLWIDNSDYKWESYPVIRIDFSRHAIHSVEDLVESIQSHLQRIARSYEIDILTRAPAFMLDDLIFELSQQKPVVILIDEYDKPLIDNLDDLETAIQIQKALRGFYGVIKSMESHLRLVFITGISKFSKISIFSLLNNLTDLTMHTPFATAQGLTEAEIRTYLTPYLTTLAKTEKNTEEALLDKIRYWYDGFCFAPEVENVYNPYSTLLLFYHQRFASYWFETATPTFLTKLIRQRNYNVTIFEKLILTEVQFGTYEIETLEIIPLLYQTGYLTIKGWERHPNQEMRYTLSYPNEEIRLAFTTYLLQEFSRLERGISQNYLHQLIAALQDKNIQHVFEILSVFFANVPHNLQINREQYYQTIFYVVFKMLGSEIDVEIATNAGRIDAVIELADHIFLFEFKLDKSAQDAIDQIKSRQYYEKYRLHGKTITCVGANFDTKTRTVNDWKKFTMNDYTNPQLLTDQLNEGDLLWQPTPEVKEQANLTHYMNWLAEKHGHSFENYHQLLQWSTHEVGDFWQSMWDYFGIVASQQPTTILTDAAMPGTEWFVDARLNYAENFFARMNHDKPAMIYKDELGPIQEVGWQELYDKSRALAHVLRELGVEKGDRVVAYMPNIPETFIALMAVTSIGAIWSSCSPDFGSRSVLDRFQQIEPKVLLAVNGYVYGGKEFDRLPEVAQLQAELPTLEKTILVPLLDNASELDKTMLWDDALATATDGPFIFEQVPFDHPLWVVYSSGTTGLPKPIVHGHGGVLLEHMKLITLHNDLKPSDRFFWYTSTGWMMWNYLMGGMLTGCTIIVFNGSPGYPDMNALWQLAEDTDMTYFGTSAAYISACIKAEITPSADYDLSKIKALGSTGSPLTLDGFQWVYNNVNDHLALESTSGGTDLCTAFVGGCRLEPIYAGEIQGAALGAKIEAFDSAGQPVIDEVGELVLTAPMPSMPVYFWNDPEMTRYKASYFEMYPGIWRHGDWIKINDRGGCVIYGRSDSTINRMGVRMGTSEIYQAVESIPEIMDSLIIDLEMLGRESYMPLFVVLREGHALDDALVDQIKQKLRVDISPRHVPNDIFEIEEVPYTLSGKKMEVPIRRILLGHELEKAANPGAMRNPGALDYFVAFAKAKLGS